MLEAQAFSHTTKLKFVKLRYVVLGLFQSLVMKPFGAKLDEVKLPEVKSTRSDGQQDQVEKFLHLISTKASHSQKQKVTFLNANVTPKYEGGLCSIQTRRAVDAKRASLFKKNAKKLNANGMRPLDKDDAWCPDLVVVFVHSRNGKKLGCFLFPKYVLVAHQVISADFESGKVAFRVWPYWAPDDGMSEAIKKQRQWMKPFWLDLSKSSCTTAVLKKNGLVTKYFA